ncbi:hypothetical protein POV26_03330 [Aequorivita todarodis]|uniref:hypothetical protein n=1 Tax=Aequorivita todarodis TaxID=2036821 RepID=UPI0023500D54|nr:hypothetical protein [Aequorivita todarodis]MDC8000055.1 hypothetical protein [Aequorivita todarodis]
MKKKIKEPDFIGGQGPLTKEEEMELQKYFTEKKMKLSERKTKKANSTKKKRPSTAE